MSYIFYFFHDTTTRPPSLCGTSYTKANFDRVSSSFGIDVGAFQKNQNCEKFDLRDRLIESKNNSFLPKQIFDFCLALHKLPRLPAS
jgi:hypothetical protein